ncbi:MAG: sugar ABC transporter permease, partial [Phototrophicales bacterium]|nr:sugar ABC transporter permease [Phototrophicales bacterium]
LMDIPLTNQRSQPTNPIAWVVSLVRRFINPDPQMVIRVTILLNFVVSIAFVTISRRIFGTSEFFNLGEGGRWFLNIFTFLPLIMSVVAYFALRQRNLLGRYISLVILYVSFVLSVVALLHVMGIFLNFSSMVDSIMQNIMLAWLLPVAYALFWIGGRLDEKNIWRGRLEQAGISIGIGATILLLFSANFLASMSSLVDVYTEYPVRESAWVLTLSALIYGFFFWRMLKLGPDFGERPDQNAAWQGWLMLSPNIIGFLIFFAGPLLLSFYLSFTDATVGRIPVEIEGANYQYALGLEFKVWDEASPFANQLILLTQSTSPVLADVATVRVQAQAFMSPTYTPLAILPFKEITGADLVIGATDRLFWISLRNTLMFCLLLVILSTIPALGLSLILNSKLPGMKVYRALYFLPSIAAVVGTALIWKWLYHPIVGFFNSWITSIVGFLNSTFSLQIADPKISWLTDSNFVLISMVLLSAWQVVGFNTVLFLAGLQGIPKDLYEAAQVDGASFWGQLRNVTIPMLAPTSVFVIITTIITGLQVFNEPYTLFTARPIPENALTSVFHLYNRGFGGFQFGYASSVAWVLFAVIFTITLIQFRVSRNNAYE